MSSEEILKIINIIPQYIQYLFPGYLTIYLYLFFRSLTLKEEKGLFIKSIAISYVYVVLMNETVKPLVRYAFSDKVISAFLKYKAVLEIGFLIIISVVIAWISYKVISAKSTAEHFRKWGIKTAITTNEIEQLELEATEESIWVCVYLKASDIVYEGYIVNKELEADRRMFLCLSKYRKYQLDDDGNPKKPYIEDHGNNEKEKVIIYYQEISIIEKRDTSI